VSAGRFRRALRWLGRWGLRAGLAVVAVLLLLVVALAVWVNVAPDRGPDVLLLTIDTQRIDSFGCYGAEPSQTPNLDRLAERATLFERVVVSIPRTTQNLSTLMTALEPRDHGVRELFDRLPDGVVTLAERLRARGYRTAAFVGGGPLGEEQNVYQGFDHVHFHAFEEQARAGSEAAAAAAWIARNAAGPWFTWVHVYDPHFYYAPPWPFWDRNDPEIDGIRAMYARLASKQGSFGRLHYDNDLDEARRESLVRLYHGETRYVDFVFGWLLRFVRFLEFLDPGRETLVVVSADHGEGVGQHGCYYNHGAYLYDDDLLVPLLVSLPGTVPEGLRVPYQVRTVDILPTIVDLVGGSPPEDLAGRSLVPMIAGKETAPRTAFSEGDTNRHPQNRRFYFEDGVEGRWRSVRDGRHKLIRIPHPGADIFELYDVETDPGETRDLSADDPETLARLRQRLAEWENGPHHWSPPESESPDAEDDLEENLERLRSLGYVN